MKKNKHWVMACFLTVLLLCVVLVSLAQQSTSIRLGSFKNRLQYRVKKQKNIYAPYVDFSFNPHWDSVRKKRAAVDLVALSEASGVKHFRLGFIVQQHDTRQLTPAWGGYRDYAVSKQWGVRDIEKLRQHGGDVVLAFGGEAGIYLSHAAKSPSQLEKAYRKIVDTYQVYQLDFDIEEAHLNDHVAITRQMIALEELQKYYHSKNRALSIGFTLPALPSGIEKPGLAILESALRHHVEVSQINILTMDYGTIGFDPAKMGTYAIQALTNSVKTLKTIYPDKSKKEIWSLMGVTPMIGVNDARPERFNLSDAKLLEQFAKKKGVRLISNWSLNRDHPGTRKIANESSSGAFRGKKMQTASFQYAAVFNRFVV